MPGVRGDGPGTALVLAGGRGTRLAPVVAGQKVLAEVGGRPVLAHVLARLAAAGVTDAVLCTGHLAADVEARFGDRFAGLRLLHSPEPEPLGTAGALRLALPRLGAEEPVLVLNGDSLCDVDLRALWTWHRARGARASVALAEVADPARFGRVEVDDEGRVLRFVEKSAAPGLAWVNAGVYLLPLDLLRAVPAGRAVSLERDVLPAWAGQGLYGYRSRASFLDVGTPDSYAAAAAYLREGRLAACAS